MENQSGRLHRNLARLDQAFQAWASDQPRSTAETVEDFLEEFDSIGVTLCFVDADRQGDFRKLQKECFKYIKNKYGGMHGAQTS